jgi:hypothetical protein
MVASLKQYAEVESTLAAHRIREELRSILGDKYKVVARSEKFGLSTSDIFVMIHDVNPAYGIADNSPVHMKFMMHLMDGFGRPVDMDKVSFEQITGHYIQRRHGIKFRKVSSTKSIDDCVDKFIKWFEKVKPELDKLIEPEVIATL